MHKHQIIHKNKLQPHLNWKFNYYNKKSQDLSNKIINLNNISSLSKLINSIPLIKIKLKILFNKINNLNNNSTLSKYYTNKYLSKINSFKEIIKILNKNFNN